MVDEHAGRGPKDHISIGIRIPRTVALGIPLVLAPESPNVGFLLFMWPWGPPIMPCQHPQQVS